MSRYVRSKLLAAPLLLLASFCLATPALAATPTEAADAVVVLETKMALRDLWVEHVFWIRSYAVQAITANAHEIAKFLSGANPYLPENAVFGLLSAHGKQFPDRFRTSKPVT